MNQKLNVLYCVNLKKCEKSYKSKLLNCDKLKNYSTLFHSKFFKWYLNTMNSKILTRLKAYAGVATGVFPPSKIFLEGGRWKSAPPPSFNSKIVLHAG